MPNCRNCKAPIFFLTLEPMDVRSGDGYPPRYIRTEPKPHPIDVNPTPAGNISLYKFAGRPYYRKQEGLVLKMLRGYGDALYTSHFDTCPVRLRAQSIESARATANSRDDRGTP
jgi:hypothetical protein